MTTRVPFAVVAAVAALALAARPGPARGDVPPLHSLPGAPASIYLNFGGAPAQRWDTYAVPITPPYAGSADDVRAVWQVVADAFAPFDLDVTTVAPADLTQRHTAICVIGGNAWAGGGEDGIAKPTGFFNNLFPNVAWMTPGPTAGDPRYVGRVVVHELGHLFGLAHHSTYDAAGNKTAEYDPGTAGGAPFMGGCNPAVRGLWCRTANDVSAATMQADMSVIGGPANGFGYRPWTAGQSVPAATPLTPAAGGSVSAAGVVEQRTADLSDADAAITAGTHDTYAVPVAAAGTVTFTVTPVGMLHARLRLLDATGAALADGDAAATMGQTVTATVPAGTVYAEVSSFGGYGDVGQYALSGTVPIAATRPAAPPAAPPAVATPVVTPVATPVATPAVVAGPGPLAGTVIGTAGSWRDQGNAAARAFDGRVDTFFDAPAADGGWCGLDLGSARPIASFSYAPRAGFAGRMVGGRFEAGDDAAFASVIASYTVTAAPPPGLTRVVLPTPVTARFVRYVGPPGSNCNIAEFQLTAAGR